MSLAFLSPFQGEAAALTAALMWAIASTVYGHLGKQIPPLMLNLIKGTMAIVLLLLTLLIRQEGWVAIPGASVGLLLLSGVVGIGLGDTFFFESLNYIGARKALLMEALAPALSAIVAAIFLGEKLEVWSWLGIGLTIAGVSWVVSEEHTENSVTDESAPSKASHLERGIGFGLLATIGQSGGAVLSRAALTGSEISPLWSTVLRLSAGVTLLVGWGILNRRRSRFQWKVLWGSPKILGIVMVAAFLGTYLGIWLQQTAYKFTAVGIAQTLSSTSPLFILPIAIVLGDRVSPRAILGVLIAMAGIWVLFR